MAGSHGSCRQTVVNKESFIVENLLVTYHPITVGKHKEWSKVHHSNQVFSHRVINSWRQLYLVTDRTSLANVLIEKVECCNWVKQWHSNTIHQSYKNDQKNI